ncbi:substrate-binding periplasmic protein [Paucibacter sp. Y2R2-4]|uniref:substrate-binding periplasmic protein n=1 Tax=Paucibacter sp. Y2R2-4 TaxID=2893553 RepID=UPI0021E4C271|nr:transporter substrate-binding domain-containing protein [Paucibacter sp. Y2R2-4]MCV2348227.1 transporter substrate-binding domain-containing protein [Paucibacter sp. Y2R2-4]
MEWVAGELPPFAWLGRQGPQGLAYELAAQMRSKLNRSGETTFYPWARAVRMAQTGPSFGVFPLARTPDRELHFNWLIPLTTVHYSFFSLATDSFDHFDTEALKARRIGVLRGSPIIKNLQAERFSKIVEAKDYKDLLRLLERQHIDAIYAGEPMLRAAIEEFGFKSATFRRGLSLKSAELYMATSIAVDKPEAELWLQAYRELELDGTVARLQKKYLSTGVRER